MALFVDPGAVIYSSSSNEATTFVQAITQYLCLSLSRNAVSPVPQVFDVSVEIFWRVLSGMRTKLKVSLTDGEFARTDSIESCRKRLKFLCMRSSFLSSK